MTRYDIIEQKHWQHKGGATASLYGAVPWVNDTDKYEWDIVSAGFTIRDNKTNEVGRIGALQYLDQTNEVAVHALVDELNGAKVKTPVKKITKNPFAIIGFFATPESKDALHFNAEQYSGGERTAFNMGMCLTWNYMVSQIDKILAGEAVKTEHTVWTNTYNMDSGIETCIHTVRAEADQHALEYLGECWRKQSEVKDTPVPDTWEEAQDELLEKTAFVDTVSVEGHTLAL